MNKTGFTNLPLHGGKAPAWLFQRMIKLAREISIIIIEEFGAKELLKKITDPFWFQSFGCILGFDWHSSGVTTTVCGALKEGLKNLENELGIFIAGGKGGTSRKTPFEITEKCEHISLDPKSLIYASKMSAKVDSTAVQDGFQLYHHNFFFTKSGEWIVVQQGMDTINKYARRYHWESDNLKSFIIEPHNAVCSDFKNENTLNMTAIESEASRNSSIELSNEKPELLIKEVLKLQKFSLPKRHYITPADINTKHLYKTLLKTYEKKPADFESLLYTEGVGPKTIRSLALIGELIYGSAPAFKDPARYSFAHGGKDGFPFPVQKEVYDRSIMILRKSIYRSRLDNSEKSHALKRLYEFYNEK